MRGRTRELLATTALAVASAGLARADGGLPPWSDPGDLPVPSWAKSVAALREDQPLQQIPGSPSQRRGSVMAGARLPVFGAKRGPGCEGRWVLVGPYAWICGDAAELTVDEAMPSPAPSGFLAAVPGKVSGDGLPYRYYFVGRDGASGFHDPEHADEEAPEKDYEPGFAVAVTEERSVRHERWGRTRHGEWVALRELGLAHAPAFKGEVIPHGGSLDFAWVGPERASVFGATQAGAKTTGARVHNEVVRWREERPSPGGAMVRVSDDDAPPAWMRARDLVRPRLSQPPDEVGGPGTAERWIDVELASQTLVAYDGERPVFATLVSSGKGPPGTDTATPLGVHRIWVKLLSTNMGNLQNEDADEHYSIEDVPYVQFFDKAVALHGAFWHRSFGHVHSHGCVNLAPADAEWLFAFTSPHLPAGWTAALPAPVERGTAIRVR